MGKTAYIHEAAERTSESAGLQVEEQPAALWPASGSIVVRADPPERPGGGIRGLVARTAMAMLATLSLYEAAKQFLFPRHFSRSTAPSVATTAVLGSDW